MARFRYSMQSILNIKLKMETQAKQEVAAARAALEEEEERLEGLLQRRAGYEAESHALRAGVLDRLALEENRVALLRMDQYIAEQRLQVERAEKHLDRAMERLKTVMMERKTHETLREKAFQQFLTDEKRQESKEIDELTSYTYGQKRREGGSGMPA